MRCPRKMSAIQGKCWGQRQKNPTSPPFEVLCLQRLTLKLLLRIWPFPATGHGASRATSSLMLPACPLFSPPPTSPARTTLCAHPFGHLTNIYEHLSSLVISWSHTCQSLPTIPGHEAGFLGGRRAFITRGHHTSLSGPMKNVACWTPRTSGL